MRNDFLENPIVLKDIPKECPFDLHLIENNEKQISQICDFLTSDKKVLTVNGFMGSGKSQIVNFVSGYLNPSALLLHFTCFEMTILDDLLLGFFETFRNYTLLGKITAPKIKVENFTQKINSYFNTITSPILIVIDSFDALMKENKSAILEFIKHLTSYPNIKIVIISKAFENIRLYKCFTLSYSQRCKKMPFYCYNPFPVRVILADSIYLTKSIHF